MLLLNLLKSSRNVLFLAKHSSRSEDITWECEREQTGSDRWKADVTDKDGWGVSGSEWVSKSPKLVTDSGKQNPLYPSSTLSPGKLSQLFSTSSKFVTANKSPSTSPESQIWLDGRGCRILCAAMSRKAASSLVEIYFCKSIVIFLVSLLDVVNNTKKKKKEM